MDDNIIGCAGVIGLVFLIVVIVLGGVWRVQTAYTFVDIKSDEGQTPFTEKFTSVHWLAGLIRGRQPDLQNGLAKYVRSGERIAKMTFVTRHSIIDMLLSTVTLFIYCPVTVEVRGTIAKS